MNLIERAQKYLNVKKVAFKSGALYPIVRWMRDGKSVSEAFELLLLEIDRAIARMDDCGQYDRYESKLAYTHGRMFARAYVLVTWRAVGEIMSRKENGRFVPSEYRSEKDLEKDISAWLITLESIKEEVRGGSLRKSFDAMEVAYEEFLQNGEGPRVPVALHELILDLGQPWECRPDALEGGAWIFPGRRGVGARGWREGDGFFKVFIPESGEIKTHSQLGGAQQGKSVAGYNYDNFLGGSSSGDEWDD